MKCIAPFFLACVMSIVNPAMSQNAKPYYYDASFSPVGNEIVFASGGDIWTVPANGGEARLLVSHPAMETRPLYSPNGKYLAFNSTRSGNGDIYILEIASGALTRLTYDDAVDELNNWSADGQYVYFNSNSKDISGMTDIFRVKASGGTPMTVCDNRYVTEYFAAPSPDGKTLAVVGRGNVFSQWWRNGSSHIDESEIWLMDEGSGKYTQFTEPGAKQLWPMWQPDRQSIYYVSDRGGKQNIWQKSLQGNARQITHFKDGRVLFPSISKDGKAIVFERDFGIWKLDLGSNEARPLPIQLKGVAASATAELVRLSQGFSDLAVSPDGKKVAFVAQGDLFAAGTKEAGEATRITNSTGLESSPVWTKNSNSLLYVSDRGNGGNIYRYDFLSNKESQLTSANANDGALLLSPDGKQLAFIRNGKELMVLELAGSKLTSAAKASFSFVSFVSTGNYAWSPDSKQIAYAAFGKKGLRNVYVVSATGGESKPVSFLGNAFGGEVKWSGDGKTILFTTGQRTENGQVARVDLQPRIPRFREDQFQDLFTDTAKKAAFKTSPDDTAKANAGKGSGAVVYEGIYDRLSLIPLGIDVRSIDLAKDGKTLVLVGNIAGQSNIYTYSLDELSRERPVLKQLTSTPGPKSSVELSNDGKDVYFIESGKIGSVNLETKQVKPIAVSAEMMVDFNEQKMEVFRQAWELQNKGFYDEHFHGVDWNAMKSMYEPYIAGSQSTDEMRRILSLMVGELNASHSGIRSSASPVTSVGKIGLRFDRNVFEKDGAFQVSEIITNGPADLTGKIHVGDYLLAVDGVNLAAGTNLDALLESKVNKKVSLLIAPKANAKTGEEVAIKTVPLAVEKGLLYKQWVQQNRAYVSTISGGRLGYVHMIDMGEGALEQLHLDIDALNQSKDGVVVDIRNNNGGFVNAYAIDALSRKSYMTMQPRGLEQAPARNQLGQRALNAPTILITNQHSLSDAEDFSEGYRTLGLGKIVGEPTAGWIIYTSNIPLFDGTVVRLPFIKVTDHEGKNMELAPRPVDIPVSNALGSSIDEQLKTAVTALLKQLDEEKKK